MANAASYGEGGVKSSMLIDSKVAPGTCWRLKAIMTGEKSIPWSLRLLATTMLERGLPVPLPMSRTDAEGGRRDRLEVMKLSSPSSWRNDYS